MQVKYKSLQTKLNKADEKIKLGIKEILALDFSAQKNKFVIDPDFHGWTEDNIDFGELLYKNYLYLCLKYQDGRHLPPSTDIDDFWHGHILDTRRYSYDCNKIFGRILHHNPYFGFGSTQDVNALSDSFDEIQKLHTAEFGAPIYEVR